MPKPASEDQNRSITPSTSRWTRRPVTRDGPRTHQLRARYQEGQPRRRQSLYHHQSPEDRLLRRSDMNDLMRRFFGDQFQGRMPAEQFRHAPPGRRRLRRHRHQGRLHPHQQPRGGRRRRSEGRPAGRPRVHRQGHRPRPEERHRRDQDRRQRPARRPHGRQRQGRGRRRRARHRQPLRHRPDRHHRHRQRQGPRQHGHWTTRISSRPTPPSIPATPAARSWTPTAG